MEIKKLKKMSYGDLYYILNRECATPRQKAQYHWLLTGESKIDKPVSTQALINLIKSVNPDDVDRRILEQQIRQQTHRLKISSNEENQAEIRAQIKELQTQLKQLNNGQND